MASSSGIRFIRPLAAADDDVDDLSQPVVGFRFHPTEEELVGHYLKMKLKGRDSHIIGEIDFCKHEPWDLPAFSLIKSDDEEWFFFSRPKYKPKSGKRDRSTVEGYWKITGKERVVKARDNRTVLGKKRILPFYRGRVRQAQSTNWVIHEYYIPQTTPNANQRDFELIRLKKKSEEAEVSTCDEGEPSTYNASDFENQSQPAHNMDFQEEYTQPQEDVDYFEMVGDLLLANTQSHNDNNRLQSGFGANELDDDFAEFLESVIVDQDQDLCEETTHTTVFNDSTLPLPLKRVYVEDGGLSSDTDTDTDIGAAHKQIMSLHRVSPIPIGSPRSKQSASAVNVVPQPRPQPQPQPQQGSINVSLLQGLTFGINCVDLVPDAYYPNEQTRRRTYPPDKPKLAPKPLNVVHLPQKTSMTKPKPSISGHVARTNNAEKAMKQTQNITTARRCSFISWQTIPLTSPRSVYICNTVLGVILFLIFAREVVLYGQWC